jgi:PAS domain S-box-containing protein
MRMASLLEVAQELARSETFDDLCRRTVELGREKLEIDRLSIWFLDEGRDCLVGTYGTGENGCIRDERGVRVSIPPEFAEAIDSRRPSSGLLIQESVLCDHRQKAVGKGTKAICPIWDGREITGLLHADNLLHQLPLTEDDRDLLSMCGSVLGHLVAKQRAIEALRESEEKYRAVFEQAADSVVLIDAGTGRFVEFNRPAHESLGYTREEFARLKVADVDLMEDEEAVMRHVEIIVREGRDSFEAQHLTRGGEIRERRVSTRPIHFAGKSLIAAIWSDITDQKRAERKLTRLAKAIENAGEGIGLLDSQERFVYANQALARILGIDSYAALEGLAWDTFFNTSAATLAGRQPTSPEGIGGSRRTQLTARRPDGTEVQTSSTVTRVRFPDEPDALVANVSDRTSEERHLKQIARLSAEAEKLLEQERRRLSLQLHDEVGQILTSLIMRLAWVRRRLNSVDSAVMTEIEQSYEELYSVAEIIRALAHSLRPRSLDERGLLNAIRSHVEDFQKHTRIECRFVSQVTDLAVDEPVATAVYRIVQESLINVARHSGASRCDLSILAFGDDLEIKIVDNGKGADPQALSGTFTLGILGMQERARAVGGTVVAENAPGGGVAVIVRVPEGLSMYRSSS